MQMTERPLPASPRKTLLGEKDARQKVELLRMRDTPATRGGRRDRAGGNAERGGSSAQFIAFQKKRTDSDDTSSITVFWISNGEEEERRQRPITIMGEDHNQRKKRVGG